MKRGWILLSFFFALNIQLFASGKQEVVEPKTQNDEWILCITEFDASSLPPEIPNITPIVLRKMVERISAVNYRTRISPEYTYYEEFAWMNERSTAARALVARQEERSRQIYRGESERRYRQDIARLDLEIEKLMTALEEIESNVPLINKEPVFNLTSINLQLSFPAPPKALMEFRFCNDNRADAFLAGSIIEFHGRYFLSVKLYTVYTRSFVWEDNIIFSLGDIDEAVEEITRRLLIVLSGNRPATVVVKTEPDDALILINRSFAGRGETEVTEYPPGMITIIAAAPSHESLILQTELLPGEEVNVTMKLYQTLYTDVDIFGKHGGSVYLGAYYVGEAPLTLRLPAEQMEYVIFEAYNGERGRVVFNIQEESDVSQSMFIRTSIPVAGGRVDKVRRHYYWAWGATWITGITAWISYYSFLNAGNALRYNYQSLGTYNTDFHDEYLNMHSIYVNSLMVLGVVGAYSIFRLVRYIYVSNKSTMPTVKTGRN